ncbi:MAG TPA: hypothetical protein VGG28_17775 [Kofleriaceae bacterium]
MNSVVGDLVALEPPTKPPKTWLLRVGWHRAGQLSYDDAPARRMTTSQPIRRP